MELTFVQETKELLKTIEQLISIPSITDKIKLQRITEQLNSFQDDNLGILEDVE